MKYFNITKPRKFDYIIFALYLIISAYIFYIVKEENIHNYFQKFEVIFAYSFFTQAVMLHALYKHFRNTSNVIYWLLIGGFHFYLAYTLKNDFVLREKELLGIGCLMNTTFLVVLIQIMRIVSFKITNEEFIVPFKFAHLFDLIDQRKSTIVDTIIILIYWGALIGLPYVWLELI